MNYQDKARLERMKLYSKIAKLDLASQLVRQYPQLGLVCWASDSGKFTIECNCPQCKELAESIAIGIMPTWAEVN